MGFHCLVLLSPLTQSAKVELKGFCLDSKARARKFGLNLLRAQPDERFFNGLGALMNYVSPDVGGTA